MTASVASFLTKAQKKGPDLPAPLSGALLLAAIRLSDAKGQAVRPYQLLVDDDGNLDLLTGEPPTGDGYAAPELRNGAVLPDDPRVLVYAAGALGYELVTLRPPRPGEEAGTKLQGPLAKLIRKAMSERQKRFRNLGEMARAIEAIHGRPSKDEEHLILAAVAASTSLPAAQKLAKIELEKAAAPETGAAAQDGQEQPASHPVFTEITGPLEPHPEPEVSAAALPPERPPERHDPEPEAERQARAELRAALQSQTQDLAQLGTRLSLLEEQVRSSVPRPLSAPAALLRDVNQLLEQRRFGEAERLLRDPVAQDNALLQFRLGQALSSLSDASGSTLARAQAAFERAAGLDPSWAQPRAQLGVLMSRLGKRQEAHAHWRAALRLDPSCPEALAALATPQRGAAALVLSGAGGAIAAALLVLAVRPASSESMAAPAPSIAPASLVPVATPVRTPAPEPTPSPERVPAPDPAPQLPKLPPPERKPGPEPEPQAAKAPRPETRARVKRVASSGRAAAEAESAKGDKALRAFDTRSAEAAFSSALKLDPTLPAAHRGMGMVYVLLGKNTEAKASYARYLELAPEAPDKDQIARLLSR